MDAFSWVISLQKAWKGGLTGLFGSALMFLVTDAGTATLAGKISELIPEHWGQMTISSLATAGIVWLANVLKKKLNLSVPGVL